MTFPSAPQHAQGGGPFGPPGSGYGSGMPPGGYGPPGAYGPPGHPGYPPPAGNPPPPGFHVPPPAPGPGADLKKQATNWLVAAAVTFFFCGGINCFGVIGAILCFLAMQAADQANLSDAESKLKWGKIVIVTGAIVSFITIAFAILYYFVAQAEGLTTS
ncbi:MAG TPA: hypothetical protein VFQ35_08750 [Polyangiaceae bacterium]|nr:hypothetical protein [Polyangiaceae bacterium]